MLCCDGVLRQGTVFGMTFLYASGVLFFSDKQGSFGFTYVLRRTIFTRDTVNCPLAFGGANWNFMSLQHINQKKRYLSTAHTYTFTHLSC